MLFYGFICLPLSHTSMDMLVQMPRSWTSASLSTLLIVSSFGLKKSWRIALPLKYLYQAFRAVKNIQYHLPVDAPEKFDWYFLVMTCALVCIGESPCMLYSDLSYREAPTEMTDNIIFLRTSVRCYSPFRFVDVFMCLVLLQVGWFFNAYCGICLFNWVLKCKQD